MTQTQFQLFLGRNIPDAGKVTADGSTKVQEIADSFKESFRQDSVLMTETQLPVCQFI